MGNIYRSMCSFNQIIREKKKVETFFFHCDGLIKPFETLNGNSHIYKCNKCNQYVLHLINYPGLYDTIKFTDDETDVNDFHIIREWEAFDQINLKMDKILGLLFLRCYSSGKLAAFERFKLLVQFN